MSQIMIQSQLDQCARPLGLLLDDLIVSRSVIMVLEQLVWFGENFLCDCFLISVVGFGSGENTMYMFCWHILKLFNAFYKGWTWLQTPQPSSSLFQLLHPFPSLPYSAPSPLDPPHTCTPCYIFPRNICEKNNLKCSSRLSLTCT